MKRRDFLRLAAGALALVGLRVGLAEVEDDAQNGMDWQDIPAVDGIFELPDSRGIPSLCGWGYVCAFNEDAFIESFDYGVTWSEMDADASGICEGDQCQHCLNP